MERDIALYLRDPHVAISHAPQEVFLDPSHTYRLWSHDYAPRETGERGYVIRRLRDRIDADRVNYIYAARKMAVADPDVVLAARADRTLTVLVAESTIDGTIVGTVTGVDHEEAFNDPEHGSSLWWPGRPPAGHRAGTG